MGNLTEDPSHRKSWRTLPKINLRFRSLDFANCSYYCVFSPLDVLAIVIDKHDLKNVNTKYGETSVQEFVVVNDEKKPMVLTLWGDVLASEGAAIVAAIDKMPIISATRLHVSDYNGTSLSARGFANIVVNPLYPETQSLKNWRETNQAFLTELVQEKKYFKRSVARSIIPPENFSSVANVITSNFDDKFWVKVTATIMDVEQKFWYMACSNCFKSTSGQFGWDIHCNFCRAEAKAIPRTKFFITLADAMTQFDVAIFGELAESLLGLKAPELMKIEDEGNKLNCCTINESLKGQWFIAQIKKKPVDTHHGVEYHYNVASLTEVGVEQPPMGN